MGDVISGKWGCLSAVVMGGVGLVLFGLGFDSHTTEAMPFGAVLTAVGLFVGVPSLQALRAAALPGLPAVGTRLRFSLVVICVGLVLVGIGIQPRTTEAMPFGLLAMALGLVLAVVSLLTGKPLEVTRELVKVGDPVTAEPPTSIRCENCGSPAPLRLSEPTHATCAHCGSRFALGVPLVMVMRSAQVLMRAQGEAERQISAILKALPEKHVEWRARLLRSSWGLTVIAVMVAIFGVLRRNQDDHWPDAVLLGVTSAFVALALGRALGALVPKVAQGIVGHWAALQVPGVQGLSCRVCGAALPSVAAPVLRCDYCSAESLAGPSVQALVAKQSVHAVRSVLAVSQRNSKADELAAFSMVAFPVVTLVAWFAVGAVAGGVGGRWLSNLHVSPASGEFAVVRVMRNGAPEVCAAALLDRGGELELKFSGDFSKRLPRAELSQFAVEPNVNAKWFVGHLVNGGAKIDEVYSLLRSLNRVEAAQGTNSLYFPYEGLGGEFICFDDVPAQGAALGL